MKITLLGLAASMLVACSTSPRHAELIIATDATFAPFHWIDEGGSATGFDVELAKAVAADAGFVPRVIVLPYTDLFTGLNPTSHDMVAATTGITAERQRQFAFSDSYFMTCQVAVVRAGADEPQNLADLSSRRIGAAGSGTSASAMSALDGVHVSIADGTGLNALREGAIDAWIVDEFDAVQAANGEFRVLPRGVSSEQYGLVMALNRPDLTAAINRSLSRLRSDGTLQRLLDQFGVSRDANWPVNCE